MAYIELLAENEVTEAKLIQIFTDAGMMVKLDPDLTIETIRGLPVYVLIEENKKLLKFMIATSFQKDISQASKHAFANKLNENISLIRFYVMEYASRPNFLAVDCYLPYGRGILINHIIETAIVFSQATISRLKQCDTEGLIFKMKEEPKRIIHTEKYFEKVEGGYHEHNYVEEKGLTAAAAEIQKLLDHLAQKSSNSEVVVNAIQAEIKRNLTLKTRLINALKAGGVEALKAIFDHPFVSVPVETIKGFLEAEID